MPAPIIDNLADAQRVVDELWDLSFGDAARWMVLGVDIPFTNGWVNFGGGYRSAALRKLADGTVEGRGLVMNGTPGASICTLPVGWRPSGFVLLPTISNGVFAYLQPAPAGTLVSNGAAAYVSLDVLRYQAEQ